MARSGYIALITLYVMLKYQNVNQPDLLELSSEIQIPVN